MRERGGHPFLDFQARSHPQTVTFLRRAVFMDTVSSGKWRKGEKKKENEWKTS